MANKNNGYHSKNTKNYIKLSIIRNGLFEKTNIDYCNSHGQDWEALNRERMNLETGILGGLTSMGSGARALVFADAVSMRNEVEAHAYFIQKSPSITSEEERFRILHTCKAIKEGVDFLETLLQINFPREFPNELVHSVLYSNQLEEVSSPIIEELTPITDAATLTIRQMEASDDEQYFEEVALSTTTSHPDLIDGMDPGLAMHLYNSKKDLTNNFTEMPEGTNDPEALLVNGMDPGLAEFLIRARESRVSVLSQEQQTSTPSEDTFSFEP